MIYWTTIQRQNPGGAKYHDYPLGLNVYLNTTDNTKLHINTRSHFTLTPWLNDIKFIYLGPRLGGITAESTVPAAGLIEKDMFESRSDGFKSRRAIIYWPSQKAWVFLVLRFWIDGWTFNISSTHWCIV